jgi:SAM-dependent methyltransferase
VAEVPTEPFPERRARGAGTELARAHDFRSQLSATYGHYTGRYAQRWSPTNPGNARIVAERESTIELLLRAWSPPVPRPVVLDVGCGSLTPLTPTLRALTDDRGIHIGADLLIERLVGLRAVDDTLPVVCADGAAMPIRRSSVDIALLFTVLSSVPGSYLGRRIAADVDRILRPGGAVLWYDMRRRSPGNPNVSPISRRQLQKMFPGYVTSWRTLTLVPPLARRLGRLTGFGYPVLAAVPFLRTHLVGLLTKPS